ncbi:MAG: hypothetical protein CVV06_13680, partial [Gammaproteobacteria bacterium HGW-Gammaproteobacteria-10]
FMAMLFCSVARRENRRIASYVTVFAKLPLLLTPLTYIHVGNAATGQKSASESRKCGRAKYSRISASSPNHASNITCFKDRCFKELFSAETQANSSQPSRRTRAFAAFCVKCHNLFTQSFVLDK